MGEKRGGKAIELSLKSECSPISNNVEEAKRKDEQPVMESCKQQDGPAIERQEKEKG